MGPLLEGLYKLQIEEDKLRGMNKRLERAQRAVVLQQNKLKELEDKHAGTQEEIKKLKSEADSLNLEIKSREATVEKYKTALNSARNNKEYAAILTELNTNKVDNSKLENKILEIYSVIEEKENECTKIEQQIEEQKKTIDEVKEKAADKINECQASLEETRKNWQKAASEVDKETLQVFKRLSETYDGDAVAFIEKADPKKNLFHCGGCFMALTNEVYNRLLSKDEIIRCPSCSRIIILNPEEEY
ncbi:Putative zinc ribbon domain protein [Sedimentisphaera cyanobacteriorum]|uniref:Zinc ribbon domain protein n=1 Tax=Sedimentisphaera cyanobacteriorum TaxID=1940790 RepID=A0A1Q2HNS0_9BACT|nr:C4-type zinc ribbon domain-containing protein [Sedimentisphaera cyanobacteriorum]AQQ09010.1 Putative zinc ribbon domain protein [Sedimentisphaera cyanobacteriorum]